MKFEKLVNKSINEVEKQYSEQWDKNKIFEKSVDTKDDIPSDESPIFTCGAFIAATVLLKSTVKLPTESCKN